MNQEIGVRVEGEVEIRPSVTTVVLHGELDIVTVSGVRSLLDDACATQPQRLLIDLTDVPFVDVLCLSAVLAATDHVRDGGGQAFVAGARRPVRRMCALLGADDVLMAEIPLPRANGA